MMIKTKDKLTTILILIFALMIGALLATPSNVSAKAEMNYVGTIAIRNSEDGYLYGNNDTFRKADTLQAVFDDVVSNTTNVAKFSFENVTTSETLVFNYERKIVLESGALSHVGKNGQTLIELVTGVLEIAGAQISTDNANVIKVCEGAEFTLSSGLIAINERLMAKFYVFLPDPLCISVFFKFIKMILET